MSPHDVTEIEAAEVVLPCSDLGDTLAFFTDRLGFHVAAVFPADDPSVAVIAGHGLRIRLERRGTGSSGTLRLLCLHPEALADGATELVAPNGTRVELVDAVPPLSLPPVRPSLVLTRMNADVHWVEGRAGMRYRDLIPDRQGGRFIASHIRIAGGGPVPDYVHFHRIHLQIIHCHKGWVRVVYEDQGPPFELHVGDCVLQPPGIRHRVLESSPELEVIEIICPADHETLADPDLVLPTPIRRPEREFGGQRFVRHQAVAAEWRPCRLPGFESRDTGIAAATGGMAGVRVVRCSGVQPRQVRTHDGDLLFAFVLRGETTLCCDGRAPERLAVGDCFVIPAGLRHELADCSDSFEFLEVASPAGSGGA